MCGRYVSVSTPEALGEHFEVDEVRAGSLGARYNVAPSLDVYALLESDGSRRLGTLRWGFVPHWARSLSDTPSPINARVEGLDESGMFRGAFRKRRCIIPADGFYEWRERESASRKQPYFIHDPDDEPLAFAGLWTAWRGDTGDGEGNGDGDADEDPVYSCAIVTTGASGPIRDLHPRMPVMLPRGLWRDWLTADPGDAPHLQEAVATLEAPDLEAYAITTRVNNVRNDGPELLEPGTVED